MNSSRFYYGVKIEVGTPLDFAGRDAAKRRGVPKKSLPMLVYQEYLKEKGFLYVTKDEKGK